MTNPNETFGRLLRGAINSIAAYEGKATAAIEEELGAAVGLSAPTIQRYKSGVLPPEPRTTQLLAEAALRRGYLGRTWLTRFLQAARFPAPEPLISRLTEVISASGAPGLNGLPTGTIALLFTDIADSSARWEHDPHSMERALEHHDAILRQAIERSGGQIFKTVGDAFYSVFTTVPAALDAAIAAQRALHAEVWSPPGQLLVRMAIHVGAPQPREGDYFGPPLNRLARILSTAHGGQILLSASAQELVRDLLPAEVGLRDLGVHQLKDLGRPEQLFQVTSPDLMADFPPIRAMSVYRHNLPAQVTTLIGRERELERITELLCDPEVRLLTLVGPGGTGKTRLALAVASELVEQFSDGVWYVELAPIHDPAHVVGAIAQALGVHVQKNVSAGEQLARYLAARSVLLVLDNFEQVGAAAPLVAELLAAAPRLKVFVTSREPLHLYGEREFGVPPLTLPERRARPSIERLTQYEAVRLFIERAGAVRPDFVVTPTNAPLIAEICHRLDGLPLAIELAAARSKIFTPQAILARLDQRLATLTSTTRDRPVRQQTLRGAIDWSYNLLDAAEQICFARLGVFVSGCTLAAAQVILEAGGDILVDPTDILASLVDKSLLRQVTGPTDEPRFMMLETIREFALDHLTTSGEKPTYRAHHFHYMQDLASGAALDLRGPNQRTRLQQLEAELENLRAALVWGLEAARGNSEVAASTLRLSNALTWFWVFSGRLSEGRTWNNRFFMSGVVRDDLPPALYAEGLWCAGMFAAEQADTPLANQLLEQSRQIAEGLDDRRQLARTRIWQGFAAMNAGDEETIERAFHEGLQIARAVDEPLLIAEASFWLGVVALNRQQYDVARRHLEQSLAGAEAVGDGYNQGVTMLVLADVDRSEERYPEAQAQTEQALMLLQGLGDQMPVGTGQQNLGYLTWRQGDLLRAAELFRASARQLYELGQIGMVGNSLIGLAGVYVVQRKEERAAELWGAAEPLLSTIQGWLTVADQHDHNLIIQNIQQYLDPERLAMLRAVGHTSKLATVLAEESILES